MFPTTSAVVWVRSAFGADLTADPSTWDWTYLTARWHAAVAVNVKDGRSEGASQAESSEATFTLKNSDGALTPDDPRAEYAPHVVEGTPVWWTIDAGHGEYDLFQGYVTSWTPKWPGRSRHLCLVEVVANGILTRLGRGQSPLLPPLQRAILAAGPVAYWQLDDGPESTQAASGLTGGTPMSLVFGEVDFGSVTGPLGTGRHPEFLDADGLPTGRLLGPVTYTDAGFWQFDLWVYGTAESTDAQMNVVGFTVANTTKMVRGEVNVVHNNGLGEAQVNIYFYEADGDVATLLSTAGTSVQTIDGDWHHIAVKMVQATASTFDMYLYVDGVDRNSPSGISGEIGQLTEVYAMGNGVDGPVDAFTSLSLAGLGVYANDSDPVARYIGGIGHAGETASERFTRICAEEGIPVTVVAGDSAAMGPQPAATVTDILRECERTDLGRMSEAGFGIWYRPGPTLSNQEPAFTIDGSNRELAEPFDPTKDLKATRNEWKVSRSSGSSAVYADLVHQRTRGRLDDTAAINPEADSALQHHARWRTRVTTAPGMRYPSLSANLARSPGLIGAWQQLQLGDRVQAVTLLDQHPTAPVDQIIEGRQQTLRGRRSWRVTMHTSPAQPYTVGVVQGTGAPTQPPWRPDTAGAELAARLDAAATSAKLATTTGPEWTTTATYPADFPFRVGIGQRLEELEVRAVVTDTPAFIAAGVVAHAVNGPVTPGLPAGMTAGVAQAMLCTACIRNSGAGVPDTPAGWLRLPIFPADANVQVFGAYHVGAAAPTISFTGGVAGADTSAQIIGLSGVSLVLDEGRYRAASPSPQVLLNASAQNITFGPLSVRRSRSTVFWVGWKADDWTSVGGLFGGTVEIAEPDTTGGDDQGFVWNYRLNAGAPADEVSGAWTVTGGGNAISRSAVFALRPLQTFTLARAMNGVVKSYDPGAAVALWDPPAIAL